MNEYQLQELALKAQQHPLGSTARRIALSKLIDGIYRSRKLCYPYQGRFSQVYQHIYEEAVQDLFLYICKNIDKYDPNRAEFITWVNMLLTKRFFKEAVSKVVGKTNEIKVETSFLENLEDTIPEDNEDDLISDFQKIRQYIEKDPKGIFRQTYIKSYPQVNFQKIAIKRWSGVSWKDISEELGVPIPTLSNFYRRSLEKFRIEFKDLCDTYVL
ncbi:MAG: sigma-70 family RNA polymerase sigma factor [Scytonema sp. PMC 1069.18]|nr:sigma-70 family RNA polymerase sigma factor [Scytonema sp. PMC 1069.18]MEC4886851.1 sigma-70 family RNA polymerase sigma factor [Scytonema sp. PMC 1070.18]